LAKYLIENKNYNIIHVNQERGKICAAIGQKIKEQIRHTKELCKHTEIEITGSDLTEKKPAIFLY